MFVQLSRCTVNGHIDMKKDWDKIVRELEHVADSDEDDCLNEVMVKKNAQKIADALHHYIPGLDPEMARSVPMTTALGTSFLRDGLKDALKKVETSQVGVKVENGVDDDDREGEHESKEKCGK